MKPEIQLQSVSGIGTNITLPRLRLAFDIGVCPRYATRAQTVLITHGHIDHLGSIAIHAATRNLIGMPKPTYLAPPHLVRPIENIMEQFAAANGSAAPYDIVDFGFPDKYVLSKKQGYHIIKPIPTYHRVEGQGYGIWSSKFVGPVRIPSTLLYAYTGDTTIRTLESEHIRTAKTLFIEATYLCDKVGPEKAHARGHIHLDDIVERADAFENQRIVFVHFSDRYRDEHALEWLQKKLPDTLKRRGFIFMGRKLVGIAS